jgi:hypothetical protein
MLDMRRRAQQLRCCVSGLSVFNPGRRKLGLEPRMIEVKGQRDYGRAFSTMDDARGQPIILPASPMFL